jgi:hypothetical protein
VSLSWPERLKVAIGPSRVDVVRARVGWRAAAPETYSVECEQHAGDTRNDAVVAAFRNALERVRGGRKTCSIVLSNNLVRYAMLPWRAEITDTPARQAYALAFLANTYGAAAEAWELMLDESAYGEPTAICGVDRALLAGLRGAVRDAGLRLASVQPYFTAAFNHCRRRMRERDLWFAVVEPERMCLAQVTGRSLRLLRSQRAGNDVDAELAAMVERESLTVDPALSKARLYVFAPGMTAASFKSLDAMDVQQLDADSYLLPVAGDARYAMALA